MKLLILTAWYHPFIHPRAHRWTALAEHWAKEGHEVHVLTARVGDLRGTQLNGVQVHRVGFDSLKEWVYYLFGIKQGRGRVGVPQERPRGWLEWLYKATWKNIFFPDDACIWYFPARKKLFQLLEKEPFDALITVSLPFTDHLLGLAAKRRFPGLHWVVDIGDPFSIQAKPPNNSWLYKGLNLRLERRVLESADAVSVTTQALVNAYAKLFSPSLASKIKVIPPLSAEALAKAGSPAPTKPSVQASPITLAYFGALYAPTRTPDAFLNLIKRAFQLRPDLKDRLSIHFYGEIFPEFYDRLSKEPAIHLHGLRSREEVREAMQSVDILVNIGNTTDFQLPSKAVDYLASGKPILNLSYVEKDPFALFFEGNPMIFNFSVKETSISETQVIQFLAWLEREKPVLEWDELTQKIKPYLVENIADQYQQLIMSTPNG